MNGLFPLQFLMVKNFNLNHQETPPSKSKPKRRPLPKDLLRVVIRHEPEQTHCSDCGHELHRIGEDISEKLVFIPVRVEVEQHVRPQCVCRQCEPVTVYQDSD
ncbi:IS66 family transposase zinc-finger binding domain-containing protein [Vibrio jasicida]|uniref:IS66 family transposase zinc-finger binding domain-containing protein n=1 Tax=Vibrio jasicida TaxID=766224 RepID=UPI0005EF175C